MKVLLSKKETNGPHLGPNCFEKQLKNKWMTIRYDNRSKKKFVTAIRTYSEKNKKEKEKSILFIRMLFSLLKLNCLNAKDVFSKVLLLA